jgi:hypothetical protein
MPRRAACLIALCLAACSAQTPELRVMLAADAPAATAAPDLDWSVETDLAGEARAFFFGQADLYLAGASPASDGKLADVLRAMGRDDLVDTGPGDETVNGCPQQWVEMIELIARATTGRQIVIVESDRHAASQTAFLKDLVTRLASDGFTAYADDGLTLGPGGAAHPDVLLVSEGLVTRDPGHGRLIREVKRGGLQLVDAGVWWTSSSELSSLSPAEQSLRRLAALSSQVSRRIFANAPQARVIIHVERSGDPSATHSLKDSVAAQTGETPLVVALTACAPADSEPAFVPSHGDGAAQGAAADKVFAIPRAAIKEGRLTSGRSEGESVVGVPPALLSPNLPVLVEARRVGDPDLAVPEDRLMLLPGDQLPLILPPGDYRIEAWTRAGPVSAPVAVSVS